MCGIVGLLNASSTQTDAKNLRSAAIEAATQIHKSTPETGTETLSAQLAPIAAWTDPLPGFHTTFRLGTDSAFAKDLDEVIHALEHLSSVVAEGQEQANGFRALEQWNELGVTCQDLHWRLKNDIQEGFNTLKAFFSTPWKDSQRDILRAYWDIEYILRNLQRLEIRGRDSGGISVLVRFPSVETYDSYISNISQSDHAPEWTQRTSIEGLLSGSICGPDTEQGNERSLSFVYKVASEIGSIGQNIREIRQKIQEDRILRLALEQPGIRINALSHTRWASNGIINIQNAHPQGDDNASMTAGKTRLFAVLNGDIDNYPELLAAYTRRTGEKLHQDGTTDAKIIPILIEERYRSVGDLREAFRQVLREFTGSFAIALHHLDHPDLCWLGIGGSGQSLYVGIHDHALYYASELYGVVEGTSKFVKLDGEKEREAGNPESRGQMLELSRQTIGSDTPFLAWGFDGTPLTEEHLPVKTAQITTRDINIAGFPHFFLKEISESIQSVRKTLHGRFFLQEDAQAPFTFNLDESAVPESIIQRLNEGKFRHIYCIGQGTAAVAAIGVAHSLRMYLGSSMDIRATKATELSGHMLNPSMEDVLVIAVSQSGTTTDTNRTVDLVRQREGKVLAILNRRNSDLAFKADGVIFTSDGRDVEMSVASTKAFYSQVTAGALLALYLAHSSGQVDSSTVLDALRELTALPEKMETVLAQRDRVEAVAKEYALKKRYWAVVGSGANQIAAHEIRIKLSELCYKSMSCDFIEDKKHIDLSAEPLMLISAAGLDEANLSDSVKEVAIFKAHSSIPIVITDRGADRFEPYASAVFAVPPVPSHLSPVLVTIIGHLFGYYAARAIDDQSMMLRRVRSTLLSDLPALETHPENLLSPHSPSELRNRLLGMQQFLLSPASNSALEVDTAVRTAMLGQRLLHSLHEDMTLDIEDRESPFEVAQRLLQSLTQAIQELSRPIDAIKHQAKTVTVGISRPSPTLKGAIGDLFRNMQIDTTTILWRNLTYLIAAEPLLKEVRGATLYRVEGLDSEGQPTDQSRIYKETATGIAANLPSRTEKDHTLKGSKWLALRNNSLLISIGRQDGRHIAILPLRSSGTQEARILLMHLTYDEASTLQARLNLLRTRGPIYDQFRASVTETNRMWTDDLLLQAPVECLFDDTPERFIEALNNTDS